MDFTANERVDFVNDKLSLIQKTDGLTFGTDALLLASYVHGKYELGVELGGGSGIISMLLLSRDKAKKIYCVEVQEEYARLIDRNAKFNSLDTRLFSVCGDIRTWHCEKEADLLVSNPPYMKSTSGFHNANTAKNAARHEIHGDIAELLLGGARQLKFGGTFAIVYRPDRLCDLVYAMRKSSLEPKRMTFVHADTESEASMVLIDGKRGGKSGMRLTKPLIIYKDASHKEYGDDMKYIMDNGIFPKEYKL